jgi:hypothetical protein
VLKKLIGLLELLFLLSASAGTVAGVLRSPSGLPVNNHPSLIAGNLFITQPPALDQANTNAGGQQSDSGNPGNVRIPDRRLFNPNSTPTYTTGVMPGTTIKASEYGALCNGTHDDTAAIQAAVDGLSVVSGGVGLAGAQAMGPGTVELPQGRCEISSPIVLMNYGSLMGSANGTWMSPKEPWHSSNTDMVEIVESYTQSSFNNQSISLINRFVKNINFWYNYHAHAFTAIKVWNPTGHTPQFPYPKGAGSNPQTYQIPGVTIEGNTFYTLDTAVDFEDCGECLFSDNQIFFVRTGVVDGGNNYGLVLETDWIQAGSFAYTPVHTGYTNGVTSFSEGRWSCTGGEGAACTGGTIAQDVIASPQGLTLNNVDFEAFDIDANIVNCLAFIANNNGFDTGGATSGVANPAVYLGQLKFVQMTYNFMASNRTDANVIEIAALTGTQKAGLSNQDGVWITGNFIYSYSPSKASGIQFDKGTIARRNVYITENQFTNLTNGVSVLSPLNYSTFRGNYGASITGQLFNFNAPGASSFLGTYLDDNTSPNAVPIFADMAGGGLVIGYNQSVMQLTGTFTATGPGCTIAAGAVGNTCAKPATIVNQFPFPDANYTVTACSVVGASGASVVSVIDRPSLGAQFAVYETALTTTATGGGIINCSVTHR